MISISHRVVLITQQIDEKGDPVIPQIINKKRTIFILHFLIALQFSSTFYLYAAADHPEFKRIDKIIKAIEKDLERGFQRNYRFSEKKFPIYQSKKGIISDDFPFKKAYVRIAHLLARKECLPIFLNYCEDLSQEVLEINKDLKDPRKALHKVLERWEHEAGFSNVVTLNEVLEEKEFHEVLLRKNPINDLAVGPGHGIDTHRIQWNMITRDFKMNPHLYTDNRNLINLSFISDLYASFGNISIRKTKGLLPNP